MSAEDRLWAAWPGGGAWLRPTKFKLKGVCQSVSDNPSLPPSLINTRTPIGRHRGGGGSTNQRRGWLARRPAKINIWDCMSLTNTEDRLGQAAARPRWVKTPSGRWHWACPKCHGRCWPGRWSCYRCGAARPGSRAWFRATVDLPSSGALVSAGA